MYEIFRNEPKELNLHQRPFKKFKTSYVIICIYCDTCYCRYKIEFVQYYLFLSHTHTHIHFFSFCIKIVQERSTILTLISSRDFVHDITCQSPNRQKYFSKYYLYGTWPKCNEFPLIRLCIHESEDNKWCKMVVNIESYKRCYLGTRQLERK